MKKILFYCAIIFLTTPIFCVDWGGRVFNDTSFVMQSGEFHPVQFDMADFYISAPLNKKNTATIDARASFQFTYDDTDYAVHEFDCALNLDTLRYSQRIPTKGGDISLSVGRFFGSDLTGVIFSQQSDGVNVGFQNMTIQCNVYLGYTGLLNAKVAKIFVPADTDYYEPYQPLYAFAPRFVPLGFSVYLPALFNNQNLGAEFWTFFDANGDNFNRSYITVSLDGFTSRYFFYDAKLTFCIEYPDDLSLRTLVRLNVIPLDSFLISFYGDYSSGENGLLSPFVSFTKSVAFKKYTGDVYYSGIAQFGLNITKIFVEVVQLALNCAIITDCTDDSPSYDGVNFGAGVAWNIFQDLQAGLSFTQFIGNDSDDNRSEISIKVTLAY